MRSRRFAERCGRSRSDESQLVQQMIDRRTFLAIHVAAAVRRMAHLPGPTLRIGIIAAGTDARSRHDGALLGIEEAKHAAELFGGDVQLVVLESVSRIPSSISAIIANESADVVRSLTDSAARGAMILMNVSCPADVLRGESCSPFLFHVGPSEAMLRDARARASGATDVVAWDGALVRFGADTLNDRFRKRFGRSMNSASWASWFAVKALWESSLRMKSASGRQLAEYLTRDTTQFDGHKGRPLSFRRWDHQLRQFVYGRVGGKPIDIPQSASPQATSREFLDRLGVNASATTCRFQS